ncbi:syntaxin-17-like [Corticium candelabrum]|uniref:syntaxin-17-like n=1 Tax=Corticium candelabrum TaxID=121492 RepID=UPI002E2712DD|nr:syntaxin-17-like [Corticium candelabrum]
MATFEPRRRGTQTKKDEIVKQPLSALEPAIKRFTEIAIPEDVKRLKEHQETMTQLQQSCKWRDLSREQIAATSTLKRLKQHLVEMERLKSRVHDDNCFEFEQKIRSSKESAVAALQGFRPSEEDPLLAGHHPLAGGAELMAQQQHQSVAGSQESQDEDSAVLTDSWQKLTHEVTELNNLVHEYANLVHHQGEMVDSIQSNIEGAHHSTQQAARDVGKASVTKAAIIPLTGAVVGTLVGGPVGLLIGAKVGALLTAVGGGYLGYKGGQIFKRKREHNVQEKLDKLSDSKRSSNS